MCLKERRRNSPGGEKRGMMTQRLNYNCKAQEHGNGDDSLGPSISKDADTDTSSDKQVIEREIGRNSPILCFESIRTKFSLLWGVREVSDKLRTQSLVCDNNNLAISVSVFTSYDKFNMAEKSPFTTSGGSILIKTQ